MSMTAKQYYEQLQGSRQPLANNAGVKLIRELKSKNSELETLLVKAHEACEKLQCVRCVERTESQRIDVDHADWLETQAQLVRLKGNCSVLRALVILSAITVILSAITVVRFFW